MTTRIFTPHRLTVGSAIELSEGAARHLLQVLRMKPGGAFVLFNGQGGEYAATLDAYGKHTATARIESFDPVERESPLQVTLAQCVSKGERMDYTLQKAVELGVSAIVPLLSERSVVRLDSERWERKLEHWHGVIVAACEQSGRTRLPRLAGVEPIDTWIDLTAPHDLRLVLAPGVTTGLRTLPRSSSVTLLIGPEGGLSDAEIAQATARGFTSVHLGPRILRTETAGAAALACLQALWGDWQ